jgi:hypothetical protein
LSSKVVIEALVQILNRDELGRDATIALDGEKLDRRKPVEPARKPRDFSVMSER